MSTTDAARTETATLGGGCFWCLDAVYRDLRGVTEVVSGYAGGYTQNPSYGEVCGKKTGHAEVVRITFDPAEISFADLLRIFFSIHDPTTQDRQGNDVGPQYRSIILHESEAQRATAVEVMDEITAAAIWPAPLVTDLTPLQKFWPAESEHQDYFTRTGWNPYCQMVIAPKVRKFRQAFADRLRRPAA